MVVLFGMSTIQHSARRARLSMRLSKWACPKITSGQRIQISTVDVINIAADRQKFMTLTGELS